ncbi:MAG: hypothetical protein M3Y41_19815 [Pseudomonadota bacterium]|nr:hypothetical protein [Pseudomonadota bacterium]
MTAVIVEETGGYLLLGRGDGFSFAVVEKRTNRLYNCHDDKREGIAADDLSLIPEIVDESDWVDEATARAELSEVVSRWTEHAERLR